MKAEFNKLSGVIVGLGSIGNRHLNNCLELGVGQMSVVRRPNSNSQFSPPDEVSVVHSIAEALQSKPDFAIQSSGYLKEQCAFVAHDIDELEGAQQHDLFAIGYNYHPDAPADAFIEHFSELLKFQGNVYCLSLIHISEPTRPY